MTEWVLGLKIALLTAMRGLGLLNALFDSYPWVEEWYGAGETKIKGLGVMVQSVCQDGV